MKPLICPKCEKEFKDVPGVRADKRLSGHLAGKHNLKGDEYWKAMGEAFKRAYEKETTQK